MILDTATVDSNVALESDVCVIGSGAGGAVVARELAEAGRSVVVLEDGSYVRSGDFVQREEIIYPRIYRESGTTASAEYAVLVSQGRLVGGSTVPGFCLCVRPPRAILAHWARSFDLPGIGYEGLYPHLRKVEKQIGVRRITPEQVNPNSGKLLFGSEQLGYRGYLPFHNRSGCLDSGYCALGCTYDRKGDMLTTYVPAASKAGAVVVPDCEARQIVTQNGRAIGVDGLFNRSRTGTRYPLKVRAKVVVLAAGAINSPRIWRASRLPDPADEVGRNLRLQPHVAVSALYPESITAWRGIPQGYVVDEFLRLDERSAGHGYLLIPTFAFPVAAASVLPGYGAQHRELMTLYPRLGAIGIFLHDHTRGRLEFSDDAPPTVVYRLGSMDSEQLVEAMVHASEVSFAAGAEKVFLPYNDIVTIGRRGAYQAIHERGIRANDPLFISYQPQGTLRMGGNPRQSVVDGAGEAHAVRNLFVADASVFPTSVAVPPQLAVMTLATRTAQHIVANAEQYFR
ncbi:MAG: GMC family oxidoreductase [Deltaproteobacteria bacterium]|nr:GMC family oxidoreductase [Deltaproteobacteria bacterium]